MGYGRGCIVYEGDDVPSDHHMAFRVVDERTGVSRFAAEGNVLHDNFTSGAIVWRDRKRRPYVSGLDTMMPRLLNMPAGMREWADEDDEDDEDDYGEDDMFDIKSRLSALGFCMPRPKRWLSAFDFGILVRTIGADTLVLRFDLPVVDGGSEQRGMCILDPCDQRWAELIFPRVDGLVPLLALRATCRAFRAQLDKATHLWRPLTMDVSQMCNDERELGWPGIVRAMQRDAITLANCDAGKFVSGPVILLDSYADNAVVVGGRIVVFEENAVCLFDLTSGDQVASFELIGVKDIFRAYGIAIADCVVQDRWFIFLEKGRCSVFDYVTLRGEFMSPEFGEFASTWEPLSVCCSRFALMSESSDEVIVFNIEFDGSKPVLNRLACLPAHRIELCERGQSFMWFARRQYESENEPDSYVDYGGDDVQDLWVKEDDWVVHVRDLSTNRLKHAINLRA